MFTGLRLTAQDPYLVVSICKIILMKAGYTKERVKDIRKGEMVVTEETLLLYSRIES